MKIDSTIHDAAKLFGACLLSAAMLSAPLARAQATEQPAAATAAPQSSAAEKPAQLQLNFQNVPLQTVLDYLSRAAGFVIVKNADVKGNVSIVSQQPVSPDEAAALLDTTLHDQGFAAVRNGRTLTIVTLEDARKHPLDVSVGSNPSAMPDGDQMVTQIIPVQFATASQLVENLKGLLPSWATITANESSNAIVLTDTKSDVKRAAQIIQALDQSISTASDVRVYKLEHGDAMSAANLVNQLFTQNQDSLPEANGVLINVNPASAPGVPDEAAVATQSSSSAQGRRIVPKVFAVGDERTNSLVVTAPKDAFTTIDSLIKEIDTAADIKNQIRVFQLRYADATILAQNVQSVFGTNPQAGQRGGTQPYFGGAADDGSQISARQLAGASVQVIGDARTNSLVVSAPAPTMDRIAEMVTRLDQNPAKSKRVHVFKLSSGNGAYVAQTLQQMFGQNAPKAQGPSAASGSQRSAIPGAAFGTTTAPNGPQN